jgi:transposase InsO family protein
MGEIRGGWLTEGQKVDILGSIEYGKEKGMTIELLCGMWMINRRRVARWRRRWTDEESLGNLKPGPLHPVHALLPEERAVVMEMARREEYADSAHRILAVDAWEKEMFFVSFSTVYRILRVAGLMSMRGIHGHHNGGSIAPVRKELTGPDQRWCWDISYLPTFEKGVFLYLYLLLDEYSRKAIQWLVSWYQDAAEARHLLEGGLMDENILDLPDDERPEVINDRGRQMKAGSIKKMFECHHMPQLFARPRTPNDNPFVESMFGTVKRAPEYPGRFLDREAAVEYFDRYFLWYNTEHYHSGIDYVTPEQCHRGLREKIVTRRRENLQKQRQLRKEVNRTRTKALTDDEKGVIITPGQLMACSVMNP